MSTPFCLIRTAHASPSLLSRSATLDALHGDALSAPAVIGPRRLAASVPTPRRAQSAAALQLAFGREHARDGIVDRASAVPTITLVRWLVLALAAAMVSSATLSCAATHASSEPLVRVQMAADFDTYELHRVGLLPIRGEALNADHRSAIASALVNAIGSRVHFEIVPLTEADLEEIPANETFRRGWTPPKAVLALARRYHLDGLFVGAVSDVQTFPPQKLSIELDLLAVETGLPIWSAETHLDASEERVRARLEEWSDTERAPAQHGESWELTLLSPRRFAQFAAQEIAVTLDDR